MDPRDVRPMSGNGYAIDGWDGISSQEGEGWDLCRKAGA